MFLNSTFSDGPTVLVCGSVAAFSHIRLFNFYCPELIFHIVLAYRYFIAREPIDDYEFAAPQHLNNEGYTIHHLHLVVPPRNRWTRSEHAAPQETNEAG
jgi:hypothetical protein